MILGVGINVERRSKQYQYMSGIIEGRWRAVARKRKGNVDLSFLPSVPNFVWMPNKEDSRPPAFTLLLLELGGNYLFGEWDDNHKLFKDSTATILEEAYGLIDRWCIVLDSSNNPIDTRML